MGERDSALVWFRHDLRLTDQPALAAALSRHERVVPCFVFDEDRPWAPGAASRWGLHQALAGLEQSLRELGSRLILRRGRAQQVLPQLLRESGARAVYWNRRYEPAAMEGDRALKAALTEDGIDVHGFNAALLAEPWEISNRQGQPYKVFTPFWKVARQQPVPEPLPAPDALPSVPDLASLSLESLELTPKQGWDAGLHETWPLSESAAQERLAAFVAGPLADYARLRDCPARAATSRLSPALHFGLLSPRQVWWAVMGSSAAQGKGAERFLAELGWREFAHHLLFHFPHTTDAPLDERFADFPWRARSDYGQDLQAWQQGQTGIPIVDAGMRELWHSGWMHNRVRMIVASLLCKNLLIPWQEGARWFWDTLVDADLANNTLGWQWVAGSGADAAPYFRIFNPLLQGEKFDPQGEYVRRWVPEIAELPARHIHQPWNAPDDVLARAGIRLDHDYPRPIVDLKGSRQRALAAFEQIKRRS